MLSILSVGVIMTEIEKHQIWHRKRYFHNIYTTDRGLGGVNGSCTNLSIRSSKGN